MSRLSDGDGDDNSLFLWDSWVRRGAAGKRGRAFLTELKSILENMPEKRLIADDWITTDGEVCVLGAYCRVKKDWFSADKADAINCDFGGNDGPHEFATMFNLPLALCWELEYYNDLCSDQEPEARYVRVMKHIDSLLDSRDKAGIGVAI